jgi:hypothetical protein
MSTESAPIFSGMMHRKMSSFYIFPTNFRAASSGEMAEKSRISDIAAEIRLQKQKHVI